VRSDARDNRERVLAAARVEFGRQGPRASLNKIAQQAGVGPGTLYRHFPTLQALLVAIVADDVAALCAEGRRLLTHPAPEEALLTWLHAVAVHATAMGGLVASEMAAVSSDPALSDVHAEIRGTGAALWERVASPPGDIDDLLALAAALAWASPHDPDRLDRLFTLAFRAL
jgi:AcrR family transcriptional regulator